VNIEFIEPRRPSRKAWLIAGIPWVVVLILGVLYVFLQSRVTHERDARLAAEALAKTPVANTAPRIVPPYQEEAMAALKRAALPEADALAELEHVAVIGIQLRSIDVNPAASVVVVELEATSDEVLGDYLDQLNAGMPTPKWHIRRVAALGDAQLSPAAPAPGSIPAGATRSATIAREI
jgi:hypothetical protein